MASLVLFSKSPRRRELLSRFAGHCLRIAPPDVDEHCLLPPRDAAGEISLRKARAGAEKLSPGEIGIAADTLVDLDGAPLGKPGSEDEAIKMLTRLSDRRHRVHTGVTVTDGSRFLTEIETSNVRFAPLTAKEIRRYVKSGEPMDKAGAYGVQERGALFIPSIEGDFYNVMGLPLFRLAQMLKNFGVDLQA